MMKRVLSLVLIAVLAIGLIVIAPVEAEAASQLTPSQAVMDYLRAMEGFSAVPCWDFGQWSIAYGNRCPDDKLEQYRQEGIPIEDAYALFAEQIQAIGQEVSKFVNKHDLTLTQHQFDSLVCLTYNRGPAWLYMENEPVAMAVIEGDMGNKFIAAMSLTCYAGGDFFPGLMRRRLIEADMYLNGIYGRAQEENYCYVRYKGNGGDVTRSVQGYDSNLFAPIYSTAVREGYTFLGWFTEPTGGVQVTELKKEHNEMLLYAHWEENTGSQENTFEPVEVTITTYKLNVRNKPGTWNDTVGTVTKGDVLTITAIQEAEGVPWGRIETGWISLAYSDYKYTFPTIHPEDPNAPVTPQKPSNPGQSNPVQTEPAYPIPDKLPITGTVYGTDYITAYNGPHTSYPKSVTIAEGEQITIYETYEHYGVIWGRCDQGWVRTNRYILLDGYTPLAHSFTVTVTYYYVYVRSGPSNSFTILDTPLYGTQMEIDAVVAHKDRVWGHFSGGWITLGYTDYDSSKLDTYQNHSYGPWEVYQDPASAVAQERRYCQQCDHYETRIPECKEHSFGPWQEVSASTCTQAGQQCRDCRACGFREYQDAALGSHVLGQWFVSTEATCTVPGKERRECEHCDYFEEKEIPILDHVFGQWTQVTPPTCIAEGEERRTCQHCEAFESRPLATVDHVYGSWTQVTPPTCIAEGEERRTCQHCEAFETRALAIIDHVFGPWQQVTPPTYTQEGQQRRDCQHCDHFETEALPCKPAPVEKEFATVTGANTLNIRSGPGTRYTLLGALNRGDKVQILEKQLVGSYLWGRTQQGWICITGYAQLETLLVDSQTGEPVTDMILNTYATVTGADTLNIRANTGTRYELLGVLNRGDKVLVLEQKQVGYYLWARIDQGWICITGYAELETVLEQVEQKPVEPEKPTEPDRPTEPEEPETVTKTYATVTGANTLNIRAGASTRYALLGVLYKGQRVEVLEQKQVGYYLWARIEQGWICITGYAELETVQESVEDKPAQPDTVTKTYATVTGADTLNIRADTGTRYELLGVLNRGDRVEVLEQKQVGYYLWARIEQGWICITGYAQLETVTQQAGQEETQKPAAKTFATVTVSALSLREGPGTGYTRLGFLYMGDRVEILEQKQMPDALWGRTEQGWICLTDYTHLETVTQ